MGSPLPDPREGPDEAQPAGVRTVESMRHTRGRRRAPVVSPDSDAPSDSRVTRGEPPTLPQSDRLKLGCLRRTAPKLHLLAARSDRSRQVGPEAAPAALGPPGGPQRVGHGQRLWSWSPVGTFVTGGHVAWGPAPVGVRPVPWSWPRRRAGAAGLRARREDASAEEFGGWRREHGIGLRLVEGTHACSTPMPGTCGRDADGLRRTTGGPSPVTTQTRGSHGSSWNCTKQELVASG